MKFLGNKIKILLILIILLCVNNSVFCQSLNKSDIENIIKTKLQDEYIKTYNTKDISLIISGIPFDISINSPDNLKIEILNPNSFNQANGFRKVLIKDSKGNTLKSFSINIQSKIYKEVLVANTIIPYNSPINNQNTAMEKREISKLSSKVIDKIDYDMISKRNLQKGSLISTDVISKKPDILKNSLVDIVFISNKITIKLQGKALKEGIIGDVIPVKSNRYNRIYNAKISSENEVIVRI